MIKTQQEIKFKGDLKLSLEKNEKKTEIIIRIDSLSKTLEKGLYKTNSIDQLLDCKNKISLVFDDIESLNNLEFVIQKAKEELSNMLSVQKETPPNTKAELDMINAYLQKTFSIILDDAISAEEKIAYLKNIIGKV